MQITNPVVNIFLFIYLLRSRMCAKMQYMLMVQKYASLSSKYNFVFLSLIYEIKQHGRVLVKFTQYCDKKESLPYARCINCAVSLSAACVGACLMLIEGRVCGKRAESNELLHRALRLQQSLSQEGCGRLSVDSELVYIVTTERYIYYLSKQTTDRSTRKYLA